MAEDADRQQIPSITSYDAAPLPLPVPPRRDRLPRWALVAISVAVGAMLLVGCILPFTIAVLAIRGGSRPAPERVQVPEGSRTSSESTIVAGAQPDAALTRAIARDYPGWRFLSGTLSEQTWAGGGQQTWTVRLQRPDHQLLEIEVEYARDLGLHGKPDSEWTTDEDFFKRGGNKDAFTLLDRIGRDENTRPLVVAFVDQEEPEAGKPVRYHVTWETEDGGRQGDLDYLLDPERGWVKAPGPPASSAAAVEKTTAAAAKLDRGLAKTVASDYPRWQVRSADASRERWADGGRDTWKLRLECIAHPGVLLDVVYSNDLEGPATALKPDPSAWRTTEGVFSSRLEPGVGDGLLDAFAADVQQRPVLVMAGEQQPSATDRGARPFRVSYRPPNGSTLSERTYVLRPGNRWTARQ